MDDAAPDPRIGTILQGRYKVVARISQGGMGAVYRGERLQLGRAVAIKFLHAAFVNEHEFLRRFDVEAQAMSRLGHPHCVSVIDFGVEDVPYVVMEYVHGRTLRDVLEDERLPTPRALVIVRQILAGLAHAHKHGIVHRDVKPANVMLTEATGAGDHVRILDFGLAKLRDGTGEESRSATAPLAIGTPSYMSPEQARGERVDARSDLYSVGVLSFEMLAGRKPFVADEPFAIIRMHLEERPPSLDQVAPGAGFSPDLDAVVRRALAKRADERWQTAAEFAEALEDTPEGHTTFGRARSGVRPAAAAILAEAARAAAEPSPPPAPAAPGRRRRLALPLALAVVAVGAGAAFALRDRLRPEASPGAAAEPAQAAMAASSSPLPSARAGVPEASPPLAPAAGADVPSAAGRGAAAAERAPADEPAAGDGAAGAAAPDDDEPEDVDDAPPPPAAAAAPRARTITIKDVQALIRDGQREEAIAALYRLRRENPKSPLVHYLLGNLYFDKRWWTPGLKAYREAIRLSSDYRRRATLNKNAIRALGHRKTASVATSLILHDIGRAALPYLDRAARGDSNPQIRARAADLAKRLRKKK